MPLPSSGPISLNEIAVEFGGSVPHALNEYYGVATGIPTSGQISIGDFYGASASNAWNIATATMSGTPKNYFSIAPQDAQPTDVFFKPDGTRMYVTGSLSNYIYEYSLSTAWDVGSASYVRRFSVAAQEAFAASLFFKPDGTKMYVLGTNGVDVNEYTLSTAWDVTSASYVRNFSVSGQESGPNGMSFKPDGTKMYIVGTTGDDVNEYSLSTAWNVSTASYVRNFYIGGQELNPHGVYFKSDGTKMYIVGVTFDAVYQYNLSTAWNVSTASYTYPTTDYLSTSTYESTPTGMFFKSDGTKMYVIGSGSDAVNEYSLSTAWAISTASYVRNFYIGFQEYSPSDVFFKSDGTKMYVLGSANDRVNEYSLSTAWNVSTASYVQAFSVSSQESNPQAMFFKSDGTRMFVIGTSGDDINEYSLSTAWDVSTASYLRVFSVSGQERTPRGLFFKPDGTKMYITGGNGQDVNEYSLSSAWNIITASYVRNFSVVSEAPSPQDVFFKTDGTKMFVMDGLADCIWAWDVG